MKESSKKLMFVILLNLFLVGLGLFIFDSLDVITFGELFSSIGLKDDDMPKIEDPFLLQREEMKKQWKVLKLKESEYTKDVEKLKKIQQAIKDKEEKLKSLERKMKDRENKIVKLNLDKSKRENRIRVVALQLMNMPPEKAVARLEQQTDDLLIIEIFRMIDRISVEQGKRSMVAYYISIMNKKRAAVIQRKMANISPMKKIDF